MKEINNRDVKLSALLAGAGMITCLFWGWVLELFSIDASGGSPTGKFLLMLGDPGYFLSDWVGAHFRVSPNSTPGTIINFLGLLIGFVIYSSIIYLLIRERSSKKI